MRKKLENIKCLLWVYKEIQRAPETINCPHRGPFEPLRSSWDETRGSCPLRASTCFPGSSQLWVPFLSLCPEWQRESYTYDTPTSILQLRKPTILSFLGLTLSVAGSRVTPERARKCLLVTKSPPAELSAPKMDVFLKSWFISSSACSNPCSWRECHKHTEDV